MIIYHSRAILILLQNQSHKCVRGRFYAVFYSIIRACPIIMYCTACLIVKENGLEFYIRSKVTCPLTSTSMDVFDTTTLQSPPHKSTLKSGRFVSRFHRRAKFIEEETSANDSIDIHINVYIFIAPRSREGKRSPLPCIRVRKTTIT
jgi:hypothetical protein